ncbi:glycosyltransferase family 4 protein [uncultured Propionivibrio sp.]|uniref:glycosyltransferase family 4 protein n=1 Tax=uncultured Propionivibrio sp. TaxID=426737 RepID=UPI0029C05113|nr:glycosyltransferase family 4 protein [uncultured Propionivibrio sp.]
MSSAERPLRLALVRQRYNPFGGAERFIERALGALVREGAEITLITRNWNGAPREGFSQHLCDPDYSRLFGGRAARDRSFAACAQREMRSGDYDITQSHERIPGCMIFRAGDGVHAAWLDHRGRNQSPLARYVTRLAPFHRFILAQEAAMLAAPELRAVICNSVMVREEMRRYYDVPESKLVVIENGIDLDQYHPRVADLWRAKQREALGLDPDVPVFLYVGSGFARKGVPQLIEALARCSDRHSHLVIVGEDRHATAYQRQAGRLGLGSRVIFAGPQKNVLPYYGMADAFVLPTRYDPMPNAALEALACGLPTITSTTCGIAARIRDGENGFVGDALDIDRLATHLDTLSAPGQANGMRAAARAAVADLDLGHMADELLNLYRRLR